MGTSSITVDITGQTVAANIRRIRRLRRMRLDDVADLMSFHGRPMSKATLSQIENCLRRVDVDDLMTFCRVLKVNPASILLPPMYPTGETAVELTGFGWRKGSDVTAWSAGRAPLDPPEMPVGTSPEDWWTWSVVDLQHASIAADDEDIPHRRRA